MKKIMFNDEYGLTKAVLERRKTQTRRIITPKPTYKDNCGICWKGYAYGLNPFDFNEPFGSYMNFVTGTEYDKSCRRYRRGEVIAVAQSYKDAGFRPDKILYRSIPRIDGYKQETAASQKGWSNKMFVAANLMPHQIRITDVRVERLQDISDDDCLKEGVVVNEPKIKGGINMYYPCEYLRSCAKEVGWGRVFHTPREAFAELINNVSRKDVWQENPYVFVYDFELVD